MGKRQSKKEYIHSDEYVSLSDKKDKNDEKDKNEIKKHNLVGLSVDKWLNELYNIHHLRGNVFFLIKHLKRMSEGREIKLLSLDDKAMDIISSSNKKFIPTMPSHFFRKNYVIFKKGKGTKGLIKRKGEKKFTPFEFDIEWKQNHWHPLYNGYLPEKDERDEKHIKQLFGERIHYTRFVKDIRLGLNGPLIFWHHLDTYPIIYME